MILTEGLHEVPAGKVAAVVTYLEMATPAASEAKPFPTGYVAARETLDNESYRALFRAIGEPWLWTSRLTQDDDSLRAVLANDDTALWVIRYNGTPIGLVELDFTAAGICEFAFFGMVKSATGQGLGGPMMALAQRQAAKRGTTRITVHTCSLDDPRALGFYQKAGFTPVKRGVEIFADPRLGGPHAATVAPQIPCLP